MLIPGGKRAWAQKDAIIVTVGFSIPPAHLPPDSGIVSKLIGKVILTLVIINATTSPASEPLASRNELKCPPATHFSDAGEHF